MTDKLAAGNSLLDRRNESIRDLLIACDREEQSDVDIDAFEKHLFDHRCAFRCAWNLDHEVWPIDGIPKALYFFARCVRIPRGAWRNFDRDEAIFAAGRIIDGPQDVGRVPDICDLDGLEDFGRRQPVLDQFDKCRVVFGAA